MRIVARWLDVVDHLASDFSLNLLADPLHDLVEIELSKAFAAGESEQD